MGGPYYEPTIVVHDVMIYHLVTKVLSTGNNKTVLYCRSTGSDSLIVNYRKATV